MALPTKEKTWQYTVNTAVASDAAALLAIKNAMKGFGSSAWTVWGSCDSSSVDNGSGTDYWTVAGSLVWSTTGAHSWIVLTQAGLDASGKAAVCLDLDISTGTSLMSIVLSPSEGFGSANGGADGTTTARPTAIDQVVLLNKGSWGGLVGGWAGRIHAMQSTDGECTRIVVARTVSPGLWLFDKVKNPITAWSHPVLGAVKGYNGPSNAATYANFNDSSSNSKGRISTDAVSFYMTSEHYIDQSVGEKITVVDDDTLAWPLCPIGLACETFPHRGPRKAQLYDLWWGPTTPADGDCYPNDGTKTFVHFGDMVFPWNGSTPLFA